MQYPRGNQVQDCLFTVHDQRMTRIVATLKPGDSGSARSQQIHYLAFTFVTPLSAYDYNITTHCSLLCRSC